MNDWSNFFGLFIGILATLNPPAAVPLYISALGDRPAAEQSRAVRATTLTVTVTLLASIWFGEIIFRAMGIGIDSFRVGGGLLLLLMAISMLNARTPRAKQSPEEAEELYDRETVAIIPMGIPLLSGPGSIALVISQSHEIGSASGLLVLSVVVLCVAGCVWLTLKTAGAIAQALGRTGINILTRLMGLILAAIATELIANGLRNLFPALS